MKDSAGILQQAKFVGLVLQMVVVSIIFETRGEHIFQSIPFDDTFSKESEDYQSMDFKIRFVCFLFWVLGFVEFLIIFNGITMFNNQFNLGMIFAHFLSIVILVNFKTTKAHVDTFSGALVVAG